jgi:hypothetical protein
MTRYSCAGFGVFSEVILLDGGLNNVILPAKPFDEVARYGDLGYAQESA